MKCPSCREALAEAPARCPHCRLSLHQLDLQFGAAPRHFGSLTDLTGKLSSADQRRVQALLRLFQGKFPQSTCSVFLAELAPGIAIGPYTFWLANRVRFGTIEANAENNFDVLLVIDAGAGAAALTVGYGLETHLPEEDLAAALEAGRAALATRAWADGIEACVQQLMKRMREIARVRK